MVIADVPAEGELLQQGVSVVALQSIHLTVVIVYVVAGLKQEDE